MAKVRRQFILDPVKIRRARKILGVSTDTEAVDKALELVIGNMEIAEIHRRVAGKCNLKDMDQSKFNK